MRIIETQSAVLSNYEVYAHLLEQKSRHAEGGVQTRRPGNLETLVKEVRRWCDFSLRIFMDFPLQVFVD